MTRRGAPVSSRCDQPRKTSTLRRTAESSISPIPSSVGRIDDDVDAVELAKLAQLLHGELRVLRSPSTDDVDVGDRRGAELIENGVADIGR